MKFKVCLAFIFCSFFAKAQNIYISNNSQFCSGQAVSLYFNINVQPPNNTFDLFLSNSNGTFNIDSTFLGTYNTGGNSYYYGNVTLPTGLTPSVNYKLKAKSGNVILSNMPTINYVDTSIPISVSAPSTFSFPICNFNTKYIPITYSGSGPATLYYNSTTINNNYNTSISLSPGANSIPYYFSTNGNITLTQISNGCLTNNLNNTITITATPSTFTIDSLNKKEFCAGEQIKIYNNIGNCPSGYFGLKKLSTNEIIYCENNFINTPYSTCNISSYPNYSANAQYKVVFTYNSVILAESSDTIKINTAPSISALPSNSVNTDGQEVVNFKLTGEFPVIFEVGNKSYISQQTDFQFLKNFNTKDLVFGNITDSKGCKNLSYTIQYFNSSNSGFLNISKINNKNPQYSSPISYSGQILYLDFDLNSNFKNNLTSEEVGVFAKIYYDGYTSNKFLKANFDFELGKAKIFIPDDFPSGNYSINLYPLNSKINVNFYTSFNVSIFNNKNLLVLKPENKYYSSSSYFKINIKGKDIFNPFTNYNSNINLIFKNIQNNQLLTFSGNPDDNGVSVEFYNINSNSIYELKSLIFNGDTSHYSGSFYHLYPNLTADPNLRVGNSINTYFDFGEVCANTEMTIPIFPINSNSSIKLQFSLNNYPYSILTTVNTVAVGNDKVKFLVPEFTNLNNNYRIIAIDTTLNKIAQNYNNNIKIKNKLFISSDLNMDVFPSQIVNILLKKTFYNNYFLNNYNLSIGSNTQSTSLYYQYVSYFNYTVPSSLSNGLYDLNFSTNSTICDLDASDFKVKLNVKSLNSFTVQKSTNSPTCNSNSLSYDIIGTNNHIEGDTFNVIIGSENYLAIYKNGKINFNYPFYNYINTNLVFYSYRNKSFSNSLVFNSTALNLPNVYSNLNSTNSPTNVILNYNGSQFTDFRAIEAYQSNNLTLNASGTLSKTFFVDQTSVFRALVSNDINCPYENSATSSYNAIVMVNNDEKSVKITKVIKPTLCGSDNLNCIIDKKAGTSNYIIQIREIGENTYSDISTTSSSNTLTGVLPGSINYDRFYTFRIKYTKNGQIEYSNPSPIPFMKTGALNGVISGGGQIEKSSVIKNKIYFDFTGQPPFICTYTDGTNNYTFTAIDRRQEVTVNVQNNTTFSIVSLTNGCSVGTFSGLASFTVSSIDALPISSLGNKCSNQKIMLPYTLSSNIPNNATNLKIKLAAYGGSSISAFKDVELPATLSGNIISADLPNTLKNFNDDGTFYYAKIISESPKVESNFVKVIGSTTPNQFKYYGEKPTFTLTGQTSIVNGETTNLVLNVTGKSDFWSFKLNYNNQDYYYYPTSFPFSIPVNPSSTTTYYISEFNCSCGNVVTSPVPITVNVTNCASYLNITANLSTGSAFHIANKIETTSKISPSANMELNAGKEIILKPGFEANGGSVFKAKINGCNN